MDRAIVLFSGGLDSTVCLLWAMRTYGKGNVVPLTIDYGQRNHTEVGAASLIVFNLGLPIHEVATLGPGALAGRSPLVSDADLPRYGDASEIGEGIDATVVPARNAVFLAIAANRADLYRASRLVVGANAGGEAGYPDTRPGFLAATGRSLSLALTGELGTLVVDAPLAGLDKRGILELADTFPGSWPVLAKTMTCYEGTRPACAECRACVSRAEGFRAAGLTDPLEAR